jgi:hypothetical protein
MKIDSNSDGSSWIQITKSILLFRTYSEVRFWAPKAGIKHWFGLRMMCNCRFRIFKGYKQINWQIRLPFFYWERDNNSWCFGTNKIYLWWHVARTNMR